MTEELSITAITIKKIQQEERHKVIAEIEALWDSGLNNKAPAAYIAVVIGIRDWLEAAKAELKKEIE